MRPERPQSVVRRTTELAIERAKESRSEILSPSRMERPVNPGCSAQKWRMMRSESALGNSDQHPLDPVKDRPLRNSGHPQNVLGVEFHLSDHRRSCKPFKFTRSR
jgi:hypothetical protein